MLRSRSFADGTSTTGFPHMVQFMMLPPCYVLGYKRTKMTARLGATWHVTTNSLNRLKRRLWLVVRMIQSSLHPSGTYK